MFFLRLNALLLAWFAAAAPLLAAAPVWHFSNPTPHGNNILEMAFHSGLYWQIGDRGQLYTSDDLDTWTAHNTGVTLSLRSLAFFRDKIFVSTEAGGILSGTTADALALTDLQSGNWLEGIAASTNTVVAVGDNGAIYASTDGAQWTPRGKFTDWLRGVAYGNGLFVSVGENGFLATSSDGQTWDKKSIGATANLNKAAYINDRFWVVGDAGIVLTNNSKMSFVPVNVGVTNTLFTVAGSTNEIVIAGDSMLLLGNLQTGSWSQQSDAGSLNLAPIWPYYSALWDGRLFLIGGRTGMKVEGYRTNSTAPLVWYTQAQATRSWLWSATRATGFYAACGADGTIVTSEDGVDWSREAVPSAASSEVLLGIGGNTNALIALGTSGLILRGPNLVTNTVSTNALGQLATNQTSLFGVVWQQASSPTTNDLQAIAATSSLFVAGGAKGTILTSPDGTTWTTRTSGLTNFLSSATAWPGGWVVTGAAGAILTSPDGVGWTRRTSGVTDWVYSVRYVGGTLIAVGENGLILTSSDGVRWTQRASGTTEWLNDVTWVQNTWYISGGSGLILTSPDAATWSVTSSITSKSLYSAVTDGQQLVMAGLEGVILRSQIVPLTTPVNFVSIENGANETLFLFEGVADQRFELEQNSRLGGAWIPVAPLEIPATGTLLYTQPLDSATSKFFRAQLLLP